jgi:hypothetical protein
MGTHLGPYGPSTSRATPFAAQVALPGSLVTIDGVEAFLGKERSTTETTRVDPSGAGAGIGRRCVAGRLRTGGPHRAAGRLRRKGGA